MSQTQGNESQGQSINPAWKPLLDAIPDAMHTLVVPHLQQWDKSVQDKLQETHAQYDPYKKFVDAKLDPAMLEKSLYLWNEFQNNPQAVIEQAIQAYELPYVDANSVNNEEEEYEEYEGEDITKHPQFQALMQQMEQLQGTISTQQQSQQQAESIKEFEQYLDDQVKEHGEFDKMYVTALMTQGVDFDTALQNYRNIQGTAIGTPQTQEQQTQQSQEETPVVLGNQGQSGSGLPDGAVNFGSMRDGEVQDAVVKMLQAQAENNNQG